MAGQAKQRFATHEGVNRVELWVGSSDQAVVVEDDKPYETSDPAEIQALDDHPFVKRATSAGAADAAKKGADS